MLSRPEMIGIEFAHHGEFRVARWSCFHKFVRDAERPAGIGEYFFDADAGMDGRKIGFAIVAEAQHAQRGDDGRRTRRWRQALGAAPAFTAAESGRGDVADAVAEARAIVSQQHYGAAREAGDVTRSAGTGQALHFLVAVAPGGVEIAEAIYFGGAEKAYVHATLLQRAHHVEHSAALRGAAQIGRIAHGVEKFGGGSFAENAIFKKADGAGGMRAARDQEREHRQAHADENEFAIADFASGGGYHQFAKGVAASGEVGFGTSH